MKRPFWEGKNIYLRGLEGNYISWLNDPGPGMAKEDLDDVVRAFYKVWENRMEL